MTDYTFKLDNAHEYRISGNDSLTNETFFTQRCPHIIEREYERLIERLARDLESKLQPGDTLQVVYTPRVLEPTRKVTDLVAEAYNQRMTEKNAMQGPWMMYDNRAWSSE